MGDTISPYLGTYPWSSAPLPQKGERVVVAMSGGVDSTVALVLLQERGCLVTGVTMSLYPHGGEQCCSSQVASAIADEEPPSCYSSRQAECIGECQGFCNRRDIPYYVIDLNPQYEEYVLEYFKGEYMAGRTPNPCVQCNRYIKFGALIEGVRSRGIDFDYFCTGHYGEVVMSTGLDCSPPQGGDSYIPPAGIYAVRRGGDKVKDQSYFLSRVEGSVWKSVRFPLAGMTKEKVKEIARSYGLKCATRHESQDFMSPKEIEALFRDNKSIPGDIVDDSGRVLGRHNGIEHYTIGQRRALGVATGVPLYVSRIDRGANTIVLSPEEGIMSQALIARDMVWAGGYAPPDPFRAQVKVRYRSQAKTAVVRPLGEGLYEIDFDAPIRAITPGQVVACYIDDVVVSGGIIERAL